MLGGRPAGPDGVNTVVAGVVGQFDRTEMFEQRRQVRAEPAPVPVAQAVPTADGVVRRPAPRLGSVAYPVASGLRLLWPPAIFLAIGALALYYVAEQTQIPPAAEPD